MHLLSPIADPSVSGHLWPHIHSRLSSGSITVLDGSSGMSASETSRSGRDLLELCDWITPRLVASCRAPLVLLAFSSCHAFLPAFWACLRSGLPALPLALPGSADEQQREARRLAATYGVATDAAPDPAEPAVLLLHDEGGAAFAQAIARQALLQSLSHRAGGSSASPDGASRLGAGAALQLLSFSALCSAPAASPAHARAIDGGSRNEDSVLACPPTREQNTSSSAADLPRDPQLALDPQAPAYILETSGTTGTPRAACFSGASEPAELLDRAVLWLFPLSSSSGISGAFAQHRLTAFLPLTEAIRDPDRLLALIEQHRITGFAMPPVLLSALLRHLREPSGPLQSRDLSSLTRINIGSAASSPADIAALQELLSPWGLAAGVIHTGYGLTETGVLAWGSFDAEPALALPPGETLIGPLYEQVETRFDDDGVLEVRKPFSFLGYLKQPAAATDAAAAAVPGTTASAAATLQASDACLGLELSSSHGLALESFRSGVDWFHTGDRARLLDPEAPEARPRLVLCGRAKDILVVNSRKLSLPAIEQSLQRRFPQLLDLACACALPPETGSANERLLLVLAPAAALGLPGALPFDLQQQLEQQLQSHLLEQFGVGVAAIRLLEATAFPRTSTGKILKAQLVQAVQLSATGPLRLSDDVEAASIPAPAWDVAAADPVAPADAAGSTAMVPTAAPASTRTTASGFPPPLATAAAAAEPAGPGPHPPPVAPSALEQHLLAWIRRHAPLHQPLHRQQRLAAFGIDSLAFAGLIGELERQHGRRCQLELCPSDPSIADLLALFGEQAVSRATGGGRSHPANSGDGDPAACRLADGEGDGVAGAPSGTTAPRAAGQAGAGPIAASGQLPLLSWGVDRRDPAQVLLRHSHEQLLRAANLQSRGLPMGLGGIARLHNSEAGGPPVLLLSAWPAPVISDLAARLPQRPLVHLRVAHDFASPANHQYLLFCYLEWLESCLLLLQRPYILAGNCRAALLSLELAQLLQARQLAPQLSVLLQWDPRLVRPDLSPYSGPVAYQIHRDHHGGDPQQAQRLIEQLRRFTPAARQVVFSATTYNAESVYPAGQQPYETLIHLLESFDSGRDEGADSSGPPS